MVSAWELTPAVPPAGASAGRLASRELGQCGSELVSLAAHYFFHSSLRKRFVRSTSRSNLRRERLFGVSDGDSVCGGGSHAGGGETCHACSSISATCFTTG